MNSREDNKSGNETDFVTKDREEFKKWYQDQYAGYGYNESLATFERQQKVIDECHRKIESQYNMIKSIQAYGEALQKTIDELKEELEAWKLQDEVGQIVINTLTEDKDNLNKIIDGLQAENKELSEVIERCSSGECYQCDDDNMPRQLMKQIKQLEAENPDVLCPGCEGEKKIIMGRNITDTGWCYDNCCYCNGKGSVSTVKALQYENEQLENKIKTMQDSAQKCLDTLGKYGI